MPLTLPSDRAYVIAEAGVNHDGDLEKAKKLIDVAADAGADAVKFQMFSTDEIISRNAPLADYQKRTGEVSQYDMVKRLELPPEAFRDLKTYAEGKEIDYIVTPFDAASAKYLVSLGVKALKIPSGEITNIPFLKEVAALGVFTIISTGMSTLQEIAEAVEPFQKRGTPYALLHCVSSYPAPVEQINLRAMQTLQDAYPVPWGYSDHTKGIDVAISAGKLGARIIEKHFTLRGTDPGPDHAASLEPHELRAMIQILHNKEALENAGMMEEALGTGEKKCQPCEENVRLVARRSIVVREDAKAGTVLTEGMLAIKRPGTGIAPKYREGVIGKKLMNDVAADTPITTEMLSPPLKLS